MDDLTMERIRELAQHDFTVRACLSAFEQPSNCWTNEEFLIFTVTHLVGALRQSQAAHAAALIEGPVTFIFPSLPDSKTASDPRRG